MFVSSSDGREQLLESLNVEQRAAVTHEGGPLLALAGAGTGKTTTLPGLLGTSFKGFRLNGCC